MQKAKLFMDTVVDIQIITEQPREAVESSLDRAFEAFRRVEQACSRFSPDSELMIACSRTQVPVPISPFLFEPIRFALELAAWTDGVFDPTVGRRMQQYGFNRHYLTGDVIESASSSDMVSYRDIILNEENRTLLLQKPVVIDLGAVAKGFAVDLAANELREYEGFLINAGGDLYAGGTDETGGPWQIGIQHPEQSGQIIDKISISNKAVCTSGSYERKSEAAEGIHHLIHPKTGRSPGHWVSCSVIAPFAMMADAFSTAAFIMDRDAGTALLEQAGLRGILISSDLQIVTVGGE